MPKHVVSVVKYANRRENIRKAVEMSGALDGLKTTDRVLIKPNLVMWDEVFPFPRYGVLTTSVVVEETVKLLCEAGCLNISIGESTIEDRELGSTTRAAFTGLGYGLLEDRYGVKLHDFNEGSFTEVDFGDFCLDVSDHVLEADHLINLPVLKTHANTKVSLGFKNLKGCLKATSKMFCHHEKRPLDDFIYQIGEKLTSRLTLIDGIYALEKGPAINGRAHRADVLVASTDMFAADVTGAKLLGYEAEEIVHLRQYAKAHRRQLDGSDTEVRGDKIAGLLHRLEWDWEWQEDDSGPEAFSRLGISGVYYPKYDQTLCSGCSYLNNFLLISLLGAFKGEPFEGIEFLGGKIARSSGGHNKTFLFGKCAIHSNRKNPHIKQAVRIKGCPPTIVEILKVLNENGIRADMEAYRAYRKSQAVRYEGKPDFVPQDFKIEA